jgi:hypothetical protein
MDLKAYKKSLEVSLESFRRDLYRSPEEKAHSLEATFAEKFWRFRTPEQRAQKQLFDTTHQVVTDALRSVQIDAESLAAEIIRCGRLARGELALPPLSDPPAGSTAAKIIEINRRRGQSAEPHFADDEAGRRARDICNAARKARGQEPLK